jgi:hypothetical protein
VRNRARNDDRGLAEVAVVIVPTLLLILLVMLGMSTGIGPTVLV